MFENQLNIVNEAVVLNTFLDTNILLDIKREDQIHPFISGNKYRKLKYNVETYLQGKYMGMLTFGGAYSNHIAATAEAGRKMGIPTIGIIRGDELRQRISDNATLSFANSCGMQLKFVSREDYRQKNEPEFLKNLKNEFGEFYLLPEGGSNDLAVKGCTEILTAEDKQYDYLCASVGTGGTLAGIIQSSADNQTVLGFSALKGTFQNSEIEKYTVKSNFTVTDDYCFGGYAKIDETLVRFINDFKSKTGIPLDPVYTGKMLFGIFDLIRNKKFKENSRILAIHTGGLQGISGMNQTLEKKNLPQIKL